MLGFVETYQKAAFMTLFHLANVADLSAAAGIVGTLFYLAFQNRDANDDKGLNNRRQLRALLMPYKAVSRAPYRVDLMKIANAGRRLSVFRATSFIS